MTPKEDEVNRFIELYRQATPYTKFKVRVLLFWYYYTEQIRRIPEWWLKHAIHY